MINLFYLSNKVSRNVVNILKIKRFWVYLNVMRKEREVPLEEFKFHYHLGNSVGSSDKYFMAHDLDEASEMFEYACTKRHLYPHITKVEKWNRWKRDWETVEPLPPCPTLN